jgi:hypothetical protein
MGKRVRCELSPVRYIHLRYSQRTLQEADCLALILRSRDFPCAGALQTQDGLHVATMSTDESLANRRREQWLVDNLPRKRTHMR